MRICRGVYGFITARTCSTDFEINLPPARINRDGGGGDGGRKTSRGEGNEGGAERKERRNSALLISKVYRGRRKSVRTPGVLLCLIDRASIIDLPGPLPARAFDPDTAASPTGPGGINYNNTARASSVRVNVRRDNAIPCSRGCPRELASLWLKKSQRFLPAMVNGNVSAGAGGLVN